MKFTNKVLAATVLVAAAVIAVEANGVTLKDTQIKYFDLREASGNGIIIFVT